MPKKIRDPLYGFIEIPEAYLPVIDHPLVQRLRWVSQLPLEQLVYPAAQHSRFEHSLGVMHLARKAADALMNNSEKEFRWLSKNDNNFESLSPKQRKALFKDSAGLIGLLHDIGHAPFSHTLENACKQCPDGKIKYDHEKIGFNLVEKIIDVIPESLKNTKILLLEVLNKNIHREKLSPLKGLLRDIVDGPIDVDKGDYLRRDSYHCGVVYGEYDANRLWDNVIITDTKRLGVDCKGALEAWALRFSRYRMQQNVYFHHVRNITDAMLIEILTTAFELANKGNANLLGKLLPLHDKENTLTEIDIINFQYWNDNNLLITLNDDCNDRHIKEIISNFMSRKLYKRCEIDEKINLFDYPESIEDEKAKRVSPLIYTKLREIQNEFLTKQIKFIYMIYSAPVPPVVEDAVQEKIRIKNLHGHFMPLAKHLGFEKSSLYGTTNSENERYISPVYLVPFIEKTYVEKSDEVLEKIQNMLSTEFGANIEM